MSQQDPFGMPIGPPGWDADAPGYEALASGDESVLAASGLNARPPGPRNKAALVAIAMTVLVGGVGIAATAGAFRYFTDKEPAAPTPSATPTPTPTEEPSPTPTPTEEPTPTPSAKSPAVPKPLAGKTEPVNKVNSGTLGKDYSVTLPASWTIARGIRNDRVGNLDLRMRNAAKTHSFAITTLKPATVTGPLTAAKMAAIKAALLKGELGVKPIPGAPNAKVGGSSASGYDVTATSGGKPVTIRTLVWQRGAVTYAATWRVPTPVFARSLTTYGQLLASLKYAA